MGAIKLIKQGIMTNLAAISSINKVYDHERLNPAGFPAAFVTFSGTENEFHTNAENKRVYVYRILVLAQIGQNTSNTAIVEQAEQTIEDCVGDILDTFDSDITLDASTQLVFVEAAVGQPGYVEYEGGMARSGEVTLRVHSIYLV